MLMSVSVKNRAIALLFCAALPLTGCAGVEPTTGGYYYPECHAYCADAQNLASADRVRRNAIRNLQYKVFRARLCYDKKWQEVIAQYDSGKITKEEAGKRLREIQGGLDQVKTAIGEYKKELDRQKEEAMQALLAEKGLSQPQAEPEAPQIAQNQQEPQTVQQTSAEPEARAAAAEAERMRQQMAEEERIQAQHQRDQAVAEAQAAAAEVERIREQLTKDEQRREADRLHQQVAEEKIIRAQRQHDQAVAAAKAAAAKAERIRQQMAKEEKIQAQRQRDQAVAAAKAARLAESRERSLVSGAAKSGQNDNTRSVMSGDNIPKHQQAPEKNKAANAEREKIKKQVDNVFAEPDKQLADLERAGDDENTQRQKNARVRGLDWK